jgi:hypothetical protein
MSRYYLIASLPLLSLEHAPGITAEYFLAECRAHLGGADADAAEALMMGKPSEHSFVKAWRAKDTLLRNAIVKARARATGSDPAQWLRPAQEYDTQIERLAENAFQEPNPIRQERMLDKARWAMVEELQGLDPMDGNVVLAYAVKLSLALRWAALDAAVGQETFNTLTRLPDGLITL